MPELPEVETIRRDLARELPGRRIVAVAATGARSIRRHPDPAPFRAAVEGMTVDAVRRWGKFLLVDLSRPSTASVVVHLGMSGQLLLSSTADRHPLHTHVVLGLDDGRDLRFVDPRTFGEVFVGSDASLSHLGVDAVDGLRSGDQLAAMLCRRNARLKPLLMDQGFVAGIGNIYSDEILHAARLRYDRTSGTLTPAEVRRLFRAVTNVLGSAIEQRGSSLTDEQYRDVFGAVGSYQLAHRVYGRQGAACFRCPRSTIVRVKTGGRSTFFCPRCQR
ncbi:MAG: bifunctional DNA-formamidopyrimidine glycosylase/DNA-(apurinic or apyrimidinic site) lyase [Acidimicrobiales bacterium]